MGCAASSEAHPVQPEQTRFRTDAQRVRIAGLQNKPELNGALGVLMRDQSRGRLVVQLDDGGRQLRVKPENVEILDGVKPENVEISQPQPQQRAPQGSAGTSQRLAVGDRVMVSGLVKRRELNGRFGNIKALGAERHVVWLEAPAGGTRHDAEELKVRPNNLTAIDVPVLAPHGGNDGTRNANDALGTAYNTSGAVEAAPDARVQLAVGSGEYERAAEYFRASLSPSERARLTIVSIEMLHNPAMKMRYETELQVMVMRETARKRAGREALEPHEVEYKWAFHSTSADAIDNIIANGMNRSYGGKNAMHYGEGVYFARDASYSARETYSPSDALGHKRIFLCRLARGAHVKVRFGYGESGDRCETEPPVRDPNPLLGVGELKYDTTTDGNMRDGEPQVMVAYKDGPEFLLTFTLS